MADVKPGSETSEFDNLQKNNKMAWIGLGVGLLIFATGAALEIFQADPGTSPKLIMILGVVLKVASQAQKLLGNNNYANNRTKIKLNGGASVLAFCLLLSPLAGCSTTPSPDMVRVGARLATFQTLRLTDTSRKNTERTGEIAGTIAVYIDEEGNPSEAQIDAELNRLIAREFPNPGDRETILIIKDLAKQAVKAAIDQNGFDLGDQERLILIYVKATAAGVKEGTVQYIEYLDEQESSCAAPMRYTVGITTLNRRTTMPHYPGSDRDWEAQNDARTLADAAAIKANPTRTGRAKRAARTMASEAQAKATELKNVAGASTRTHNTPKTKHPFNSRNLPPMVPPFNPG